MSCGCVQGIPWSELLNPVIPDFSNQPEIKDHGLLARHIPAKQEKHQGDSTSTKDAREKGGLLVKSDVCLFVKGTFFVVGCTQITGDPPSLERNTNQCGTQT